MENVNSNLNQSTGYPDTTIPFGGDEVVNKRVFFHQSIAFQVAKNPHLLTFAKQTLISTHPRSIYKVEFGEPGEWFITYSPNEEPVRYEVNLTRELNISDVSWSAKYNCYFDYFNNAPFVVTSDIIALIYLASLDGYMAVEVIGEWMRSATKGRYLGFNPVHLSNNLWETTPCD